MLPEQIWHLDISVRLSSKFNFLAVMVYLGLLIAVLDKARVDPVRIVVPVRRQAQPSFAPRASFRV